MVAFFGLSARARTQFCQLFAPPVFSHSFTETHPRKRATETGKSTQVSEDGGFFFFFKLSYYSRGYRRETCCWPFLFASLSRWGGKYNCPTVFDETLESCFLSQMHEAGESVLMISFRVGKERCERRMAISPPCWENEGDLKSMCRCRGASLPRSTGRFPPRLRYFPL